MSLLVSELRRERLRRLRRALEGRRKALFASERQLKGLFSPLFTI